MALPIKTPAADDGALVAFERAVGADVLRHLDRYVTLLEAPGGADNAAELDIASGRIVEELLHRRRVLREELSE